METVNRGSVQSLYKYAAERSVSVAPLVKTVMMGLRRGEIIADCLDVLQPFIEEVLPDTKKSKHYDFSDVTIMNDIIMQLLPAA